MIRSLRANKATFRTVKFEPGFNVVLADKTDKSSQKDSRNGAGKSLLVEIIHFCLGGKAGTSLKKKELHDWRFTLDLRLGGKDVSVTRGLDHPNKVEIEGDISFAPTDLLLPIRGGSFQMKSTEWARCLGEVAFGLPAEEGPQPFTPRFRSLFPFFARSGRDAFSSAFRHHRQTKVGEQQISNAFLLGLGWDYARQWQLLREKSNLLKVYKQASEAGVAQLVSGSLGELEAERVRLEQAGKRTEENLRAFKVHPEYERIEEQASALTLQIHGIANQNVTDGRLLEHYRRSIAEETGPADADRATKTLEEAYGEAGVVLPDLVKKRLEDVKQFHHALVRGRREFLSAEAERLEREVTKRKQEVVELDGRRAAFMQVLETHGALAEYNRLQALRQDAQNKLAEVGRRIKQLKELEQGRSQIKIELETLRQTTQQDLEDRSSAKEKAISSFNANSEALYDAPGNLIIEVRKNGYHFDVEIQRTGATGIENMKVFCYDLTLTQLWTERPNHPGMLLHDSPMFDGVDERQKAAAWARAKAESERLGFQYICMVNTDDIPDKPIMDGFGLDIHDPKFVRAALTDQPDGCLLGVRF
ncbi:MAG: ABC-three component system protein [Limisphaerales bacterium]